MGAVYRENREFYEVLSAMLVDDLQKWKPREGELIHRVQQRVILHAERHGVVMRSFTHKGIVYIVRVA